MFDTTTPRRVLVTGASSGLGLEAAAQLAEEGVDTVVVAARTEAKAEASVRTLTERVHRATFEGIAFDVSDTTAVRRAAHELVRRGKPFDALLLNAGVVLTDRRTTDEDVELIFATSVLGHHLLATLLIEAGLLADGARVVIVGSESANNDTPRMMGFRVHDWILDPATDAEAFDRDLRALATGAARRFDPNAQYASSKAVSAWWAAAMQRRHGGTYDFYTVSPGANLGTDAARHMKGMQKAMFGMLQRHGHRMGMNMPVPVGARRYVDVLTAPEGRFEAGATYTSRAKKLVGDLVRRTDGHLVEPRRQDLALRSLERLVDELAETGQLTSAPSS